MSSCNSVSSVRVEALELRLLMAAGDFDTTFAFGTGYLQIQLQNQSNDALDIAAQSNGNILTVGTMQASGQSKDAFVINHSGKGKFVNEFGSLGVCKFNFGSSVDDIATGVAVNPTDNSFVTVGTTGSGQNQDIWIAKDNYLGQRDKTFGGNGLGYRVIDLGGFDTVNRVIYEPTGKKWTLIGSSASALTGGSLMMMRFNYDGTNDKTFGNNGVFKTTPTLGSALLGNALYYSSSRNQYYATGSDLDYNGSAFTKSEFYTGRINYNGTMDTKFGTQGWAVSNFGQQFEFGTGISETTNGNIYVGGVSANGIHEFGTKLPLNLSVPSATVSKFAFARFNNAGVLDKGFNGSGMRTVDVSGRLNGMSFLQAQSDGSVIGAGGSGIKNGNADFMTTRILSNGSMDNTWGTSGIKRNNIGGASCGYFGYRLLKGGLMYGVGHTKGGLNRLFIGRLQNNVTVNPFFVRAPQVAPLSAPEQDADLLE